MPHVIIFQHLNGILLEGLLDLDRASLQIHQVLLLLSFLLLSLHQLYVKLPQKNNKGAVKNKYKKLGGNMCNKQQ